MALTTQKVWTYEDYCKLDDGKRYEIIEGELLEMPSPTPKHQIILNNLLTELNIFLRKKKLGIIIPSPIDVKFDEMNTIQPDIIFILQENQNIIQEKAIFGSPDLVIEILSSKPEKDTIDNFKTYQKFKVKEYWIIDPVEKGIEIFILENERLVSFCIVRNEEEVSSKIFSDLKISFDQIIS